MLILNWGKLYLLPIQVLFRMAALLKCRMTMRNGELYWYLKLNIKEKILKILRGEF